MIFLCCKWNLKTCTSILITSERLLPHLYVGVWEIKKSCFLHYQGIVCIKAFVKIRVMKNKSSYCLKSKRPLKIFFFHQTNIKHDSGQLYNMVVWLSICFVIIEKDEHQIYYKKNQKIINHRIDYDYVYVYACINMFVFKQRWIFQLENKYSVSSIRLLGHFKQNKNTTL